MKKGIGMSVEDVQWAKAQLLAGATQGSVARELKVSINTIGRLARGETHIGVLVAGEEALRPYATIGRGSALPVDRGVQPLGRAWSPEEVEASAQRAMTNSGEERAEPIPEDLMATNPMLQALFGKKG